MDDERTVQTEIAEGEALGSKWFLAPQSKGRFRCLRWKGSEQPRTCSNSRQRKIACKSKSKWKVMACCQKITDWWRGGPQRPGGGEVRGSNTACAAHQPKSKSGSSGPILKLPPHGGSGSAESSHSSTVIRDLQDEVQRLQGVEAENSRLSQQVDSLLATLIAHLEKSIASMAMEKNEASMEEYKASTEEYKASTEKLIASMEKNEALKEEHQATVKEYEAKIKMLQAQTEKAIEQRDAATKERDAAIFIGEKFW